MNSVIERCVQTLQVDDRQLLVTSEQFDPAEAVREAIQSCTHPDRILLETPSLLTITTDRQLLIVVIGNLIGNACKYAAPETPIHVSIFSTVRGIEVLVLNKPGVAGHPDKERVFEKYYRSPHAKRQTGTGLGLYLVRQILEAMAGEIYFIADPIWVKFHIILPRSIN